MLLGEALNTPAKIARTNFGLFVSHHLGCELTSFVAHMTDSVGEDAHGTGVADSLCMATTVAVAKILKECCWRHTLLSLLSWSNTHVGGAGHAGPPHPGNTFHSIGVSPPCVSSGSFHGEFFFTSADLYSVPLAAGEPACAS